MLEAWLSHPHQSELISRGFLHAVLKYCWRAGASYARNHLACRVSRGAFQTQHNRGIEYALFHSHRCRTWNLVHHRAEYSQPACIPHAHMQTGSGML